MKDRAYAKINLSLDVFNIREDGYHDLCSIMVPIDFYDELEIIPDLRDSFTCNKRFIRYNENNSIYKMITLLKETRKRSSIFASRWVPMCRSITSTRLP